MASIGRFCSIASNVVTGQVEHPTDFLSASPLFTGSNVTPGLNELMATNRSMIDKSALELAHSMHNRIEKIRIGNDVWIGEGAFIRRGITIGDGAIIASRSVVTRNVPSYAIVGGSPARLIRFRFELDVVEELRRLQLVEVRSERRRRCGFLGCAVSDRNDRREHQVGPGAAL